MGRMTLATRTRSKGKEIGCVAMREQKAFFDIRLWNIEANDHSEERPLDKLSESEIDEEDDPVGMQIRGSRFACRIVVKPRIVACSTLNLQV